MEDAMGHSFRDTKDLCWIRFKASHCLAWDIIWDQKRGWVRSTPNPQVGGGGGAPTPGHLSHPGGDHRIILT